jgi:hypothetical protein
LISFRLRTVAVVFVVAPASSRKTDQIYFHFSILVKDRRESLFVAVWFLWGQHFFTTTPTTRNRTATPAPAPSGRELDPERLRCELVSSKIISLAFSLTDADGDASGVFATGITGSSFSGLAKSKSLSNPGQ